MAKNLRKDRRPPREPLFDMEGIVSSSECTGMAPTPILDESAEASYADMCALPHSKPEEAAGKREGSPKKA